MNTEPRILVCDHCGKTIIDYAAVGYDGPADRDDDSCHPLMEWLVLCVECEAKNDVPGS